MFAAEIQNINHQPSVHKTDLQKPILLSKIIKIASLVYTGRGPVLHRIYTEVATRPSHRWSGRESHDSPVRRAHSARCTSVQRAHRVRNTVWCVALQLAVLAVARLAAASCAVPPVALKTWFVARPLTNRRTCCRTLPQRRALFNRRTQDSFGCLHTSTHPLGGCIPG